MSEGKVREVRWNSEKESREKESVKVDKLKGNHGRNPWKMRVNDRRESR